MKKEIKGIFVALFIATSIATTFFGIMPVKAERTTIDIEWRQLYLTCSYDKDDDARFYVQIKYKDKSGWHVAESAKKKFSDILEGMYYPDTSFTIDDVIVNDYIYIRLMEWDFCARDDQISKVFINNSKARITCGSWDISLYLVAGFTAYSIGQSDSENEHGSWFYIEVQNLT
ncbi:MAG: hypothetical protein FK734_02760 [Asgard group archaeon]|nr:hypothetical protein [Asgard group archaeon]